MKVLLICNGNVPSRNFLRRIIKNYDAIACADGGANLAYKFGIKPNFIVGDLDSIRKKVKSFFEAKNVEIVHDPDQNSTDIEKSVKFLIKRGYEKIDITSALGDRVDHNLGNLSVLANYYGKAKLRIIDEKTEIFFAKGRFSFKANKGDTISIIPVGGKVFVSKMRGLKYKLENRILNFSGRGVSNVATAKRVSIDLRNGGVLIIRKLIDSKL